MVRAAVVAAALIAVDASGAGAQSYPARPVTLVVPFPPGGGNDALARTVVSRPWALFAAAGCVLSAQREDSP